MRFLPLLAAAALASQATAAAELQPPDAFAGIAEESARSVALFTEAGKVLQHPRCVNCHPAGDRPLQGADGHLHIPAVQRGDGGIGVEGLRCTACHQTANYDPAGVPGHPEWHLAPIEMAWEGKSLAEICEQIKDPARNGGKSMAALVEHIGARLARRLGLGTGSGPGARAGHAGAVRGADGGLGGYGGGLPAGVIAAPRCESLVIRQEIGQPIPCCSGMGQWRSGRWILRSRTSSSP